MDIGNQLAGGLVTGLTGALNTASAMRQQQQIEQMKQEQQIELEKQKAFYSNYVPIPVSNQEAQAPQVASLPTQPGGVTPPQNIPQTPIPQKLPPGTIFKDGQPWVSKIELTRQEALSSKVAGYTEDKIPVTYGQLRESPGVKLAFTAGGQKFGGAGSMRFVQLTPEAMDKAFENPRQMAKLSTYTYPQLLNYGATKGVDVPGQQSLQQAIKLSETYGKSSAILENIQGAWKGVPPEELKTFLTISEGAYSKYAADHWKSTEFAQRFPHLKTYLNNLDAMAGAVATGAFGISGAGSDVLRESVTRAHPGLDDTPESALGKLKLLSKTVNDVYEQEMNGLGLQKENPIAAKLWVKPIPDIDSTKGSGQGKVQSYDDWVKTNGR